MKCSIIIIGDEILIGQVTDTNSGAIARTLEPEGWEIVSIETVGDDGDSIRAAVGRALSTADLVITTGGLGPTRDDITRTVLLETFGGELRRDPAVTANIERVFNLRGLTMNALTADQALVPTSCTVIQNRYGTAPVMWFERDGKVLVSMPGVPFETEGMLPEVAARVSRRFSGDTSLLHATVMVAGITESDLATKLADYEDSLGEGLHLAYLPSPGLLRLRLDGSGPADSDIAGRHAAALSRLLDELGPLAVYHGDAGAAVILIDRLRRAGMTMATAESCTGGNIAHSITAIAGASDVYAGGVVSYSNEVKTSLLGVPADIIAAHGAVSREVVELMAGGACRATGARCAVATSGIAGPGGGTPDKPVGTVWVAWTVDGTTTSRCLHLPGDRARVIDRATTEALLGLLSAIDNTEK